MSAFANRTISPTVEYPPWAFLPGAPITAGLALQVLLDVVLGMVIYAFCNMQQARLDRELNGC
jgi:hypothetical protein